MSVEVVDQAVVEWISAFRLLLDERGVFPLWGSIVKGNSVKGKPANDARLVAAMARHGLLDLLTFNAADFIRFGTIHVWTPADILTGSLPS